MLVLVSQVKSKEALKNKPKMADSRDLSKIVMDYHGTSLYTCKVAITAE